jgi:hypothetical protein
MGGNLIGDRMKFEYCTFWFNVNIPSFGKENYGSCLPGDKGDGAIQTINAKINSLGADGWELVSSIPYGPGVNEKLLLFFKRSISVV